MAVEEGSDSWASISAVAQHNPGRVLVITDPNHSLRATSIARRLGLDARPSPTPYAPTRKIGKRWLWTVLHECSGLVVLDLRLINVRWAEWAENKSPNPRRDPPALPQSPPRRAPQKGHVNAPLHGQRRGATLPPNHSNKANTTTPTAGEPSTATAPASSTPPPYDASPTKPRSSVPATATPPEH